MRDSWKNLVLSLWVKTDRGDDEKGMGRALLNTAASWVAGTTQWESMSRSYLDKEIETHVDTLTERAWLSISQKCLLFHRFFHLVGCILFTVQYPQKLIPLLLHGILTPLPTLFFILQKRKNISLNVQQFLKFLKSRRNKTERIKKKKQWKERSLEILKHTHTILKSNQKQRDFTLVKFPKSNASLWYSHKMATYSGTLAWKIL